jgi:hypothetical protein
MGTLLGETVVPNVGAFLVQWANKTAAMVTNSLVFLGLLLGEPSCCFRVKFCHHLTGEDGETERFYENYGIKACDI